MEQNIIQVKIIRHSNRLDFSNPLYWMICIGQYWSDSPLNSDGYKNAKKKANVLAGSGFIPSYIYVSPYSRTLATATEFRSVFPKAEIKIEPLLAEYQPRYAHAITLYPAGIPTTYDGEPTEFFYPESPTSFSRRVQFIISKLIEKNSENIMIVTHGEVLKSYISHLQNLFPNLLLDPGNTPYLTTLSFSIDTYSGQFVDGSIKIE